MILEQNIANLTFSISGVNFVYLFEDIKKVFTSRERLNKKNEAIGNRWKVNELSLMLLDSRIWLSCTMHNAHVSMIIDERVSFYLMMNLGS